MTRNSVSRLSSRVALALLLGGAAFVLPWGSGFVAGPADMHVSASEPLDMWWPVEGAKVTGVQPFKGLVPGRAIHSYDMFWQVDNGQSVRMDNNYDGFPHKEATVDLSGWKWRGNGPYLVKFTALDQGRLIGERSATIWINEPAPSPLQDVTAVPAQTTTFVAPEVTPPPAPAPVPASVPPPAPAPAPVPVPVTETVIAPSPAPAPTIQTVPVSAPAAGIINVWWPTEGAVVSGDQPLKALLDGKQISEYRMYWQVDGGQLSPMRDSWDGYPHKETWVGLSGWTWRGSGPYVLNFEARDNAGVKLAEKSVRIKVANGLPEGGTSPAPAPAPVPAPTITAPAPSASGNVFAGAKLYVSPNSDAKRQADAWRSSRPEDARQMDKLAAGAETFWMGGWNADVRKDAAAMVQAAENQGALPVFVAYNIPQRDCGSYSAGGADSPEGYRAWMNGLAEGIRGHKAAVILEPDALAGMDCLSSHDRQTRVQLLKEAVATLKFAGNVSVYLDAGNSAWLSADEAANRLRSAGIAQADGFSLNVSNFRTDEENLRYGEKISAAVGGKHFVADTGRNGRGSNGEWCNPWGRALGRKPTTQTGQTLVDAYLWVKGPGGSDGQCNGGPSAGTWWADYALDIARNSSY